MISEKAARHLKKAINNTKDKKKTTTVSVRTHGDFISTDEVHLQEVLVQLPLGLEDHLDAERTRLFQRM